MHKGFTLVELLIVIAILAVLAVTVVVVLNPAELLKQARDSTRMSDMSAINGAIALWLTDVATTTWPTATSTCTSGTVAPSSTLGAPCQANASTAVGGAGWVSGINLAAISVGSPLSRLPLDPINSTSSANCPATVSGCFYALKTGGTFGKYKLYAPMESAKYSVKEANSIDGGNVNDWYESGTDMSL